jgi:deoxycytidylate deaminase
VGTPLHHICRILHEELVERGYATEEIHLSKFLAGIELESPFPTPGCSEFERINLSMDRGNELREVTDGGEALALLAASYINDQRPNDQRPEKRFMSGKSFIFRQLKHPDEVFWLRKIYGSAFHLIGIYCSERERKNNLVVYSGMTEEEANKLIKRDIGETKMYGQQLRDTFYLSDVFIEVRNASHTDDIEKQLKRYLKLLFAEEIITPTVDEYGMHLAYSASLRSADLSRQVGAAILNKNRVVVSLGANEVPAPKGGQYWEDSSNDFRDFKKGYDSNQIMKVDILLETLSILAEGFNELGPKEQEIKLNEANNKLSSTRLMSLTEFGRSVHAEMEAILSAGRIGVSLLDCDLYTTTFSCHNCAKHIVGAGLSKVVYIEPYPKSLAEFLHNDAIFFSDDDVPTEKELNVEREKTAFKPFIGVSPRMYWSLFSLQTPFGRKIKRKKKDGYVNNQALGLRVNASPLTYIDRESAAAVALKVFFQNSKEDTNE